MNERKRMKETTEILGVA